ncbi:cytochrome c oxidase subunit II [Prevotella sp. MGM2]|nr:cytochrome c oxidase subunit II [Prevotella sp. MGM2]
MRLMEVRHPDGRPAPDVYKKTPEEICFLQRQDGLSQDVERPDDEEEVSGQAEIPVHLLKFES